MGNPTAIRVDVPDAVRWITRTLEREGFETWAVGGAVRDALLEIPGGDWDLATRARPEDVRRVFRRTVPIGVEHGTVGVLARDRVLYEVTTFRRDVIPLGRRAVVEFADTLNEDLGRRDFTLNAIAWHPLNREWSDPHGGIADLAAGVLRTVGVPADRFREDYLRILRAVRFAGTFGLTIEPATWDALCTLRESTTGLSAERVREELWKVLVGRARPSRALGLYRLSGVLGVLVPEIERALARRHAGGDTGPWARALLMTDCLSRRDPELRFAALLRGTGCAEPRAIEGLCRRLRFSNATTARTLALAAGDPALPAHDAASGSARRRWLAEAGPHVRSRLRLTTAEARVRRAREATDAGATLARVRALLQEARARPPLSIRDLALDGGDLIALGLEPGPRFAGILSGMLDAVLEAPELNTPETLSRIALELATTWEVR